MTAALEPPRSDTAAEAEALLQAAGALGAGKGAFCERALARIERELARMPLNAEETISAATRQRILSDLSGDPVGLAMRLGIPAEARVAWLLRLAGFTLADVAWATATTVATTSRLLERAYAVARRSWLAALLEEVG